MIKTKEELTYYLSEDKKRFNGKEPSLIDWILKNEWAYIYKYIRTLRYLEYYLNTGNRMMYYWYFLIYKRMCFNQNPDNAVVGGVPAKVIKIKDQHTYD